jgi:hypothetical protein
LTSDQITARRYATIDDEKYALIEYLKSANCDNYPRIKAAREQALPCANDKNWAKRFSVRPAQ